MFCLVCIILVLYMVLRSLGNVTAAHIDPRELARVQASTTPTAAVVAFRLPLPAYE